MKNISHHIKSHLQTNEQKAMATITGIIVLLLLTGIGMIVNAHSQKNNSENISPTPTQIISETPTEEPTEKPSQAPTAAPTIKVTSTPGVTSTPSNTPTPAATSTPAPTSTPVPSPTPVDTEPPQTRVTWPQPDGELTYKTDGKVCATMAAPTDNYSGHSDIGTAFHFDADPWSDYITDHGYLCKDSLPNGPHTLTFHSRDKAGNIESDKTISFTVNIPDNQ